MSNRGITPLESIAYNSLFIDSQRYRKTSPSIERENEIGRVLMRVLSDLAMNRFKWSNLPETIDQRFIEMCLFYSGLAVFYHDEKFDVDLVVRGSGVGWSNVFDNPVSFTVITPHRVDGAFSNLSLSAYNPLKGEEDAKRAGFPIWPNYLRHPDIDIVKLYASRLATIDRTLEINAKNARRNKLISGSKETELSRVNIARAIDQGDELISVTAPMQDLPFLSAVDLGINPDSYEKLSILRNRWWNECMNLLGIDNANTEKKERMVTDEIGANNSQTDSVRYVNLQARQYACDQINKVFGLNISVDYNAEIEAKAEQAKALAVGESEDDNAGANSGS